MLCYYEKLMEINVLFDERLEGCLDTIWLKDITERILAAQGIGNHIEMGLVIASQQNSRLDGIRAGRTVAVTTNNAIHDRKIRLLFPFLAPAAIRITIKQRSV